MSAVPLAHPAPPVGLPPRNPGLTRPLNLSGFAALLLVTLIFPLFGEFWIGVAAFVIIGVLYGLGLHIITGLTGMLNLGFVGCAAFGAYLGAWLLKIQTAWLQGAYVEGVWVAHAGWSAGLATQGGFWLALAAVVAASGLLGLILGYPTLKLSGDYYAIVTLAFSEIIILAIKNLAPITGGTAGMRDIPDPVFWPELHYTLLRVHNHYVMVAALMLIGAGVLALQFSRFGRALAALRDNRTAAEAAGISPIIYYSTASVFSSIVGGVAGYLAAVFRFDLLNFESFLFMESVMVVCYVVIGGLGSFRGAIVGGICMASATEIMRWLFELWNEHYSRDLFAIPGDLRYLIFGLVLIVAMRFMPNGLFGVFRGPSGPAGSAALPGTNAPGSWPHPPSPPGPAYFPDSAAVAPSGRPA